MVFLPDLELARQHVAQGRRIVDEQRRRVGNSLQAGGDTARATALLAVFEITLQLFEDDLMRMESERVFP